MKTYNNNIENNQTEYYTINRVESLNDYIAENDNAALSKRLTVAFAIISSGLLYLIGHAHFIGLF